MVYWEIIRKSYYRNLQYRLAHLINNFASAIFGFVFISIWAGVLEGKEMTSTYDAKTMGYYISFNQSALWVTTFLTAGLGIQISVRSGAVSLDLMRPVNYFLYVISQELGRVFYNFLFRSIPVALVLGVMAGFYLPKHPLTYFWALLSLLLAVYLGLLLFYLTGASSFWTTEIRWAHYITLSLIFGLGGQMLPVELMPGFLGKITPFLPFAGVIYYPTMMYLERLTPQMILVQAAWAVLLTLLCLLVTSKARRKVEVQGG